jgi:hypothetical protein
VSPGESSENPFTSFRTEYEKRFLVAGGRNSPLHGSANLTSQRYQTSSTFLQKVEKIGVDKLTLEAVLVFEFDDIGIVKAHNRVEMLSISVRLAEIGGMGTSRPLPPATPSPSAF